MSHIVFVHKDDADKYERYYNLFDQMISEIDQKVMSRIKGSDLDQENWHNEYCKLHSEIYAELAAKYIRLNNDLGSIRTISTPKKGYIAFYRGIRVERG